MLEKLWVKSKKIQLLNYDPETFTLEVEYNDGDIYRYFGVPDYIYEKLKQAKDKDQFFVKYIKHAGFSNENIQQ